jgi:hypothetical protein
LNSLNFISPVTKLLTVSAKDIIAELPKLSHRDRRAIARQIFELEQDAQTLAECDSRADQNFLMLDELENQDATRKQG